MVNDEGSDLQIKRMNLNYGTLHFYFSQTEHLQSGVI
jgi:hypothetical protein